MSQDKSDFATKLAAIHASYVRDALPGQLAAVRSGGEKFVAAESGGAALEAVTELHAASHKLAGSSGTFGLDSLSQVARALSNFTDSECAISQDNYADYKDQISAMVDAVSQAAAETASSTS